MSQQWTHKFLGPGVRPKVRTSIEELRNYASKPAGNVWYVSRNIATSGDGKSWDTCFKTIGEAIARVNADYTAAAQPDKGRNTVIYIGEGWYSEVPLTLTANDVHIIGTAPGSHDQIVLYGSATAGGWDTPAGGPALTLNCSNCTIENIGIFTYDPLYACIKDGAHASDADSAFYSTFNNAIINCNFVRDREDGSLGGVDVASNEGPYIIGCRFGTSQKDFGVRIRSNGHTNPVGVRIEECHFVGTETGINSVAGHSTFIRHNFFYDDTTDRDDTITTPIVNSGGQNLIAIENYWEFSDANAITGGGDHLNINNNTLAKT